MTTPRAEPHTVTFTLDGATTSLTGEAAAAPLLWALREDLGARAPKFGCGVGACAACTVLVDGQPQKSCQISAGSVADRHVTTVKPDALSPTMRAVQQAWYELDVVQCGYCQPAQIAAATAYLEQAGEAVDDNGIDEAMSGNLCRCGTYPRIRQAIYRAAEIHRDGEATGTWPTPVPRADEPWPTLPTGISRYVELAADGTIWVRCSQLEMGQGIFTTVATIVADALGVAPDDVHVMHTGNAPDAYANPLLANLTQLTGGSTSTRVVMRTYRTAAQAVRDALLQLGAERLGVPVAAAQLAGGYVVAPPHRIAVAEIANEARRLVDAIPADRDLPLAPFGSLIGDPTIHRVDAPAKITATAEYTLDLAFPQMATALVLHPPQFGSRVGSFDAAAARELPGVRAVLEVSTGVAVVADSYRAALAAANVVEVEWDATGAETRSSAELRDSHERLLGDESVFRTVARTGAASPTGDFTADYWVPYLAQAPMEPTNAACRLRPDGVLEVWAAFQVAEAVLDAASRASGLPRGSIEAHHPFAGGGFGLRTAGEPAAIIEAVEIARALDWAVPVKVQWTRPEELRHGFLRPATAVRVLADVDDQGMPIAIEHRVVAQSASETQLPAVRDVFIVDGLDRRSVEGAGEQLYAGPDYHARLATLHSPIRLGTSRSVATIANEFARESAIDELAARAGRDPVALRTELLEDPRAVAVLEAVCARAGWGARTQATAQGIALSTSFGSRSATIVDVEARGDHIAVTKVTMVADVGQAISPNQVLAQLEGGIVFALGAAQHGEIRIVDGAVENANLDTYPLPRMRDTPAIDVALVASTEAPGGVGEVAGPTVAPALANAIFALTGQRLRAMPFDAAVSFAAPRATPSAGPLTVQLTENGPIVIAAGEISVADDDGSALRAEPPLVLCRCGASRNKPFCDGSHLGAGFDGTTAPANRSSTTTKDTDQ